MRALHPPRPRPRRTRPALTTTLPPDILTALRAAAATAPPGTALASVCGQIVLCFEKARGLDYRTGVACQAMAGIMLGIEARLASRCMLPEVSQELLTLRRTGMRLARLGGALRAGTEAGA
jgi:hypothetical protein